MQVFQLVVVGVLISICVVIVKQVKPELSILLVIAGSIILLSLSLNYLNPIFELFNEVIDKTGIDSSIFMLIIKIVGIGYLVEFGASLCVDSGNSSIADKLVLGGKIIIFVMAIPIIRQLFEVIMELVP